LVLVIHNKNVKKNIFESFVSKQFAVLTLKTQILLNNLNLIDKSIYC